MSDSPLRPCFNDPRIADAEILLRHVHPSQLKQDDNAPKLYRPVSGTFVDAEMSVDRLTLTTLEQILARKPKTHLAAFTAGEIRAMGFNVWWDPQDGNPAHAIVCPKLSKKQASLIACKSDVLYYLNPDAP